MGNLRLELKARAILVQMQACVATMEMESRRYGEWRYDHTADLGALQTELDEILARLESREQPPDVTIISVPYVSNEDLRRGSFDELDKGDGES